MWVGGGKTFFKKNYCNQTIKKLENEKKKKKIHGKFPQSNRPLKHIFDQFHGKGIYMVLVIYFFSTYIKLVCFFYLCNQMDF